MLAKSVSQMLNKFRTNPSVEANINVNFAERVSFTNCAEWPRMMNSWVNFLTWIAVLLLAVKCQTSATELTNLITYRNLTSNFEKSKIKNRFLALFIASTINFIAYNVFCLTYEDA